MVDTSNLVAYYKLDDTSGDAVDAHNSNDATVSGVTYSADGIINDGYLFVGNQSDYVQTPDLSARSVSLWLKYSGSSPASGEHYVVDGRDNISNSYMYVDVPTGALYWGAGWGTVYYDNGTISSGSQNVNDGNWHHIVAISGGTGSGFVVFGARYTLGESYNGHMDEIAVFSGSLSSDDVAEIYNSGSGFAYPLTNDVTFNASALSLSFSAPEPVIVASNGQTALSLSLGITAPQRVVATDYRGAVVVGTGTKGTRYVTTKYPVTEGTTAGTTKLRKYGNLIAEEGSIIPERKKQGL